MQNHQRGGVLGSYFKGCQFSTKEGNRKRISYPKRQPSVRASSAMHPRLTPLPVFSKWVRPIITIAVLFQSSPATPVSRYSDQNMAGKNSTVRRPVSIDDKLCMLSTIALTVWKKSLRCSTVMVSLCLIWAGTSCSESDNYIRSNSMHQVVLMDAVGMPLLTLQRRKVCKYIYVSVFSTFPLHFL